MYTRGLLRSYQNVDRLSTFTSLSLSLKKEMGILPFTLQRSSYAFDISDDFCNTKHIQPFIIWSITNGMSKYDSDQVQMMCTSSNDFLPSN